MNTVSAHTPPGQCSIAPLGVAGRGARGGGRRRLHPPFDPLGQGLGAGQRGGVAATGEHGGGARGDIVDVIDRDAGGRCARRATRSHRSGSGSPVARAKRTIPSSATASPHDQVGSPCSHVRATIRCPSSVRRSRVSIVGSSGASAGSARLAGVRSRPFTAFPGALPVTLRSRRFARRRDVTLTDEGGSTRRPAARSSSRRSPHHSATSRESPNADVTAGFARCERHSGTAVTVEVGRAAVDEERARPRQRRTCCRPDRSTRPSGLPSGRPRTPARGARRRTRRTSRGPQPARPS